MPVYTIETPGGRTLTIEAADEASAMAGAQQWHAENGGTAVDKQELDEIAEIADPPVLKDMGKAIPSSVARGLTETAMLPVSALRLIEQGGGWAADKVENFGRGALGYNPISDETRAAREQHRDESALGQFADSVYGAQDAARADRESVLYQAKTTPGQFTETIGEFLAPGGLPNKAVRAAPAGIRRTADYLADLWGNAVVPGAVSETAGQMTEGTDYEDVARMVGAVGGNVASAGVRSAQAPERVVRRATSDMTDADWEAALGLQNNQTGVRLTGPEAIAQATGGASGLPNLQRVVEGSLEGRAQMAPFFAERPAQVDTAVGSLLDEIAPQSPQPSTLGPRAAEAGGQVIDNTRREINEQTRPLYAAAETQQIVPPGAPLPPPLPAELADPRFQEALRELRAHPELAPDYAHLPDNSVGVVDAVTKDMFAKGEAASTQANPLYGPRRGALNTQSATNARDVARDPARGGSADYDAALIEQERLRRTKLQPVEEGPVGRVSKAGDTAAAEQAILPQNPLTGSAGETTDAIRALLAEDPDTVTALVRQALGDRYTKTSTETMEGAREFTGAKFHKDVAGNDARQEVLQALLAELPNAGPSAALPELLDVLQATGRRKPVGSATAFNEATIQELGTGSLSNQLFGLVRSLGGSLLTQAGDATRRTALRGNLGSLAEMFTDPHSVQLLRNAINRSARVNVGGAGARSAAQIAPLFAEPYYE